MTDGADMRVTIPLGPTLLHVVTVVPGKDGEDRRLADELVALDPKVVAPEIEPAHAVALRKRLAGAAGEPPFLKTLVMDEMRRRFPSRAEDPFLAAVRHARDRDADLAPLLPPAPRFGFLERRRLRGVVRRADAGLDEAATLEGIERALHLDPKLGATRLAADEAAARRLAQILFEEERSRVAAVLTVGRATRIVEHLRGLQPRRPHEAPRETATEVKADKGYPAYR